MAKKVAVIGLGVFGKALVEELAKNGVEVLAIDKDYDKVQELSSISNINAVKFDSTDAIELERFGIKDFDVAVVTIGENFESLLLTCMILKELGVKKIIARATEEIHRKILYSIGISEIISPEEDLARRLARSLASENVVDIFEFKGDYEIVQVKAPDEFVGKSLREIDLRRNYNLLLVTILKPINRGKGVVEFKAVGVPDPERKIESGDILVIFGSPKDIEKLS